MQKLKSDVIMVQPPNIESMYMYLFHCFELWKKSDEVLQANLKSSGPHEQSTPLRDASRYSLIIGSYSLLDALIHSYVSMHHFQTNKKEDDFSVYSKWKNFPHKVEGVAFKKKDILIIDKIRLLRNQIAHPKAKIDLLEKKKKGSFSLEWSKTKTGPATGYINVDPSFLLSNGIFLLNEITRLLTLAENTLSNVPFIPKSKGRYRYENGAEGVMWPDNVIVI